MTKIFWAERRVVIALSEAPFVWSRASRRTVVQPAYQVLIASSCTPMQSTTKSVGLNELELSITEGLHHREDQQRKRKHHQHPRANPCSTTGVSVAGQLVQFTICTPRC